VIGAKAAFAGFAIHEWIGERRDVARRFPYFGVHQNGSLDADDVVALLHHRAPPLVLHVALEFNAERAPIVARGETSVNLRRLKHKAAPLAQRHDIFHF
jgi:hypothetical protein